MKQLAVHSDLKVACETHVLMPLDINVSCKFLLLQKAFEDSVVRGVASGTAVLHVHDNFIFAFTCVIVLGW
jgi:hypothetical protein